MTLEMANADALAALEKLKELVVGSRFPRWADHDATTQTRIQIADICDKALSAAPSGQSAAVEESKP
jgi:hypothetical protein